MSRSQSSRPWLPPAVFGTAVLLAALTTLVPVPELLRAVLAAPLYYGVPLGIGLLVIRPLQSALSRTQQALLAYFCGLVLLCAVMLAREQGVPAQLGIHWFVLSILLVALAGFALGHRFFTWNPAARSAVGDYFIILPVFAIEYARRFGVFSDFPVTDLFQATHLMKGALEFGRFDVLNPFSAGSYVPVIQVVEGLLVRYLAFDPLLGAWTLPVFATVPKYLAYRAAFQGIFDTRSARLFATAAAACIFSAVTPTNGDLTMLGSLLVFSLAARATADGGLGRAVCVVIVGVVALCLGYFVTRSVPLVYIAVLAAACLLPLAASALRMDRSLFALVLLVVALTPIHRSVLAFAPPALLLGALLPLSRAWLNGAEWPRLRRMTVTITALTALAALAVTGLLGWILLHPAEDLRQTGPGEWLIETILGATFSKANIQAGSGPKVALFELGRTVIPSLAAFAAILLMLAIFALKRHRIAGPARNAATLALLAWGLAVALGSLLLLGVPFVYRSGFLVVMLLVIALVAAWQAFEHREAATVRRAVLMSAGAYALVAIPLIYRCGAIARCDRTDYLDRAHPFLIAIGALVLAAAAAAAFSARRRSFRYLAPTVFVLLFALENSVSRAFFMSHNYGSRGPGLAAVSHFSRDEVELAAAVRRMGNYLVVVSDPYTMSNVRALTGLNSLVTYSNLDTLSEAAETRLREWLREVVEPATTRRTCAARHPLEVLDHTVNAAEFNYWLARVAAPEVPGADVLYAFGLRNTFFTTVHPSRKGTPDRFPDDEWRRPFVEKLEARFPGEPAILLVVDRKTIAWARGDDDVDYFPDVRPLESEFVERLMTDCNAKVHDGRFALVRFPMAGK